MDQSFGHLSAKNRTKVPIQQRGYRYGRHGLSYREAFGDDPQVYVPSNRPPPPPLRDMAKEWDGVKDSQLKAISMSRQ